MIRVIGKTNISKIVKALNYTDVKLNLLGSFSSTDFRDRVVVENSWSKVNEFGFVDRDKVKEVLSHSMLGLIVNMPIEAEINNCLNKMLEYMSASIPTVTSNFPSWGKIAEENNCFLKKEC